MTSMFIRVELWIALDYGSSMYTNCTYIEISVVGVPQLLGVLVHVW